MANNQAPPEGMYYSVKQGGAIVSRGTGKINMYFHAKTAKLFWMKKL